MPNSTDVPNSSGKGYWDGAWASVSGVEEFSAHSTVVEETKWSHLLDDLGDRPPGLAAEVGCGSGHLGALLASRGHQVMLLDYSPAGIACARRSFQRMGGVERRRYVLGDALRLPFADSALDLVVSCGVLEHFQDPGVAVLEMGRVLKPGGLFYADICPDRFSLLRVVERTAPRPPGWFEARLGKKEIEEMVQHSGLRLKRLFAAGVLPPRGLPGTGRVPALGGAVDSLVRGLAPLWKALDATPIADWLGFYYYVTAVKPPAGAGPHG